MVNQNKLFSPAEPMDPDEVREYLESHPAGTYTLLDVRQPAEYEAEHMPGAKLVPLPLLADQMSELDKDRPTIVYCASGGRSRVAAQFLSGQGFSEVHNLWGGIEAWEGQVAKGPVGLSMEFLPPDAAPAEVVLFAYGLEGALGQVYRIMSGRVADSEVGDLLLQLAVIEDKHKDMLQRLSTKDGPVIASPEDLEARASAEIIEGGFHLSDFIKQNEAAMQTALGVLELAMMIEAQGLDLYLRYADRAQDAQVAELLLKIADEEKNHLTALGRLMDSRI
ncbi:MAG: ferritin-like domain-containing protein [Deltaproteobacteria bacterium]|nr:ferritin-like domain-containing protein [Deltaproteobacteria bacterium]